MAIRNCDGCGYPACELTLSKNWLCKHCHECFECGAIISDDASVVCMSCADNESSPEDDEIIEEI